MAGESTYQKVRNFLFALLSKQFFIFLFFLLLSAIVWLVLTLNETYEKEVKIPATITNIPKNVVLTSPTTDTLRVTIRDKGWILLSYLYGERKPQMSINFKNYDRGNGAGIVSASDIKRLTDQQLESSSKITATKPDKLEFFYNNGERKRVPVRWTGRVIPEQLYFISHVAYHPDSVDVYASNEKLDSILFVNSEPLNYVGFRDTLSIHCKLSHPTDVKVIPENVRIDFFTDVLTEESITVPVKCLNLPEGMVLRTFPAKVKVSFVTGVSEIKNLRPADFVVIADYLEIQQTKAEKCNIYLTKVPHGVSRAKLTVNKIDYLIEEE